MKVDDVNRPLIKGEILEVPCVKFKRKGIYQDFKYENKCVQEEYTYYTYIPVFDNYHNDLESGQKEFHWHIDTRFIEDKDLRDIGVVRFEGEIIYKEFKVINPENFSYSTPVNLINQFKYHNKCAKNGRCLHKGFNLNQVPVVDIFKRCPLHGLLYEMKGKSRNKPVAIITKYE